MHFKESCYEEITRYGNFVCCGFMILDTRFSCYDLVPNRWGNIVASVPNPPYTLYFHPQTHGSLFRTISALSKWKNVHVLTVLADYALHLKSAKVVNYANLCIEKRPLLLLCLVVADGYGGILWLQGSREASLIGWTRRPSRDHNTHLCQELLFSYRIKSSLIRPNPS
jgi:hypothetical protein